MDSQTSDNTLPGNGELDFLELVGSFLDGQLTPGELAALNEQLRNDGASRETFVRYCLQGKLLAEALPPGIPLPAASSLPAGFGLLGNAARGTVGYLSSGWPVAYLVATVVLGLGLLVGSHVYMSHPEQVAEKTAPLPSALSPRSSMVGRITGMVDCQWSDASTEAFNGAYVPLGRKYALASGLMEITYNTGAKVILQGPATYEVESKDGGYLSLGKLTAKVEKKEERRTKNEELSASRSSFLVPHSYFAVRTPTATVTDLGTEFGVEVDTQGQTTSHVFRGSVAVQVTSIDGKAEGAPHILHENESARVEMNEGSFAIVLDPSAKPAGFVRKLVQPTIKSFDLVDVVAGGDGFSGRRGRGIDPNTGQVAEKLAWAPLGSTPPQSNRQYHPVTTMPLIDGICVPHDGEDGVQIDSAGHVFKGFGVSENATWQYLWAGGPMYNTTEVSTVIGGIDYSVLPHGYLYLDANKAVTFDLDAIRRANPGCKLLRFRAVAANVEGDSARGAVLSADFWVFVDGEIRFRRREITGFGGAMPVTVPLGGQDRFLTLATTDGGNGISRDFVLFGDPRLEMLVLETNETNDEKQTP